MSVREKRSKQTVWLDPVAKRLLDCQARASKRDRAISKLPEADIIPSPRDN